MTEFDNIFFVSISLDNPREILYNINAILILL